jgi:hypothetical protein
MLCGNTIVISLCYGSRIPRGWSSGTHFAGAGPGMGDIDIEMISVEISQTIF